MKPDRVKVGLRLKKIKDELGISLSEFADRIGSTKGTFNSYLRGVALPPESAVDKIVEVSNANKEWIYFGSAREYMEDYLNSLKSYGEFVESYPDKVEAIIQEFENNLELLKEKHNINSDTELNQLINFYDDAANTIFFLNYNAYYSQHVESLVKDFMNRLNKYPIYDNAWSSNGSGYLSILLNRLFRLVNKPRFHEVDKILKVAEEQYELIKNKILLAYKDDIDFEEGTLKAKTVLEFLDAKFSTYESIGDLLKDISVRNNLVYNPKDPDVVKLIELLLTLSPNIKKIKRNEELDWD